MKLAEISKAAERLAGRIHPTPALTSNALDELVGAQVFLKCENFQRTGSFKFRGAMNAVLCLDEIGAGVCTVSSGNHAQALALAAREMGIKCVVAMPASAPPSKIAAARGYGAEVISFDRFEVPQDEMVERLPKEFTYVSSHDHPNISAGAGTAALELFDQAGPLDALIAPAGGGGGLAGYAMVAKAHGTRVIAVEPDATRPLHHAMAAGKPVLLDVPQTIADGLMLRVVGDFNFGVLKETLDEAVAVTDKEILSAMTFLFERLKIVVEPSGAAATAALISGKIKSPGRVGVIVSGGNISTSRFAELLG